MSRSKFYRASRREISDIGRFMIISIDFLEIMSMQEAIVISYLMMYAEMQEAEQRTNGVWFKCKKDRLGKILRISKFQQELILKKLETKKFLERKMMGNPARRWMCIHFSNISNAIKDS